MNSKNSFSLMEVLVALVIVTGGTAALLTAFARLSRAAGWEHTLVRRSLVAENLIQDLEIRERLDDIGVKDESDSVNDGDLKYSYMLRVDTAIGIGRVDIRVSEPGVPDLAVTTAVRAAYIPLEEPEL
jgi:NAD(P)-dependent dehydrogenase (short-subunit alcohol dehydrogenase family)